MHEEILNMLNDLRNEFNEFKEQNKEVVEKKPGRTTLSGEVLK